MRLTQKLFFLLLITSLILKGCTPEKSSQLVKIRVKAEDKNNQDLKVTIYKNLNQITLAESTLDSTGIGSIEFIISQPTIAYIQIGQKFGELYLMPGDELTSSIDSDKPITYAGRGSLVNNYLAQQFPLVEKIKVADGQYICQLEIDAFSKRFDLLKTTINNFHLHYTDSVDLPQEVGDFLKRKNEIKLLAIRQEFAFAIQNKAQIESIHSSKDGKVQFEFEMPFEFKNVTLEVPFDTTLLNLGLFDYTYLLEMYLQNKIYIPNFSTKTGEDDDFLYIIKTDEDIKNGEYIMPIQEYLVAKNVLYWLIVGGIKPSTDSIFNEFKKNFTHSVYLPALQKVYDEWVAIAPGHHAPDFRGTTLEGKTLSLSDLKGKVVYADVWATWCGPCKEEFPYSKELQKKFASNDHVVFLYVSVDKNQEAWKKMLREDPDFKGTHIIEKFERNETSIWDTYKISGIPRYILVDQNGIIVNADAPGPSSGQVEIEIEKLLTKGI